jgi:hypothetical protein
MANDAFGLRILTDLSAQMKTVSRSFGTALRRELRAGFQSAGDGVVTAVKKNSAWSKENRIPNAVRLVARYDTRGASVKITVNARQAPEAAPLELGNGGGVLWHPVFGNKAVWVTQKLHPFFFSAVQSQSRDIDLMMEAVALKTAKAAGFK